MSFEYDWENTPSDITHKSEYKFTSILNPLLQEYDLISKRVEGIFSPFDIGVYKFDYKTLTLGDMVVRIDVERKPKVTFYDDEIPSMWVRGISFLKRKTDKLINTDYDVYAIIDKYDPPHIIWLPYSIIRSFGKYENYGRKNEFLVIQSKYFHLIDHDYKNLAFWCSNYKNNDRLYKYLLQHKQNRLRGYEHKNYIV